MIFRWFDEAKEDYQALPSHIQKKARKLFRLLEENPWHPSLHVEKINEARNIWSARIDQNYRMTFHWVNNVIQVRRMGTHQNAYRRS
ncbi:MAG: hypothetical protein ACKVQC_06570 [Elusimicrobiota bacterium]